ncbi:hypothetical protein SAMN05192571_106283 [Pleomorphomonas diazotrophica]|nr:hypothetical protein SAMN05192571_106283 [Pleomorphomonas diazotrophica]
MPKNERVEVCAVMDEARNVRAANTAIGDTDQKFAFTNLRVRNFLDPKIGVSMENSCPHFSTPYFRLISSSWTNTLRLFS